MTTTKCILLALLFVSSGCGTKDEQSATPARMKQGQTIESVIVEVKTAAVPIRVEVTGQVTPIYQATLSSRIQGTIDKLLVREGSQVVKGQTLLQLDNHDVQADLARAKAEADNAKAQLDRMKLLYAEDAVSKQEFENATRAHKVAEANRNAVLAQLSYTIVKAPFDGVIIDKHAEAGELASPGQPLLKIENPRELRLEATVAESDLKSIALGDKVPVLIDALGSQAVPGIIGQIIPSGDPQTHTFLVKVNLPSTTGMKSGMFGRFQLDKGTAHTLLVPVSAIVERGELTSLFVVGTDNVARLRWVKTGRRFETDREILSGVNTGDRVLSDGSLGVDGASVQIDKPTGIPSSP